MKPIRTYNAGGKGHRMLARLEEGPATGADLRDAALPTGSAQKRQRMWNVIRALLEDGLAEHVGHECYIITAAGRAALATLRQGVKVTFDRHRDWRDAA